MNKQFYNNYHYSVTFDPEFDNCRSATCCPGSSSQEFSISFCRLQSFKGTFSIFFLCSFRQPLKRLIMCIKSQCASPSQRTQVYTHSDSSYAFSPPSSFHVHGPVLLKWICSTFILLFVMLVVKILAS